MNMEEYEEDCLFVLRMMNFIFKVKSVIFPDKLHEILQSYPPDRPSYFTPDLSHATLILMQLEEGRRNHTDIDPLFFYSAETYELCSGFNCRAFFRFSVHYGTHCVREYLGGNMEAPLIIFNALTRIIRTARESGLFKAGTWEEIDKYARKIIYDADDQRPKVPCTRSFTEGSWEREQKEIKLKDKICAESEFVLRVMNYVFLLDFRELPLELQIKLQVFDENPHPYFSPTVQAAILAEMNTQAVSIRRVGVNGLETYYENQLLNDFNVKTFLEACVCLSKKAIREYCEERKLTSPRCMHGYLAMQIGAAREKDQFKTWVAMEQAAIELIADYEAREESQKEKELSASFSEDALKHFAAIESGSGSRLLRTLRNTELECPGCQCY